MKTRPNLVAALTACAVGAYGAFAVVAGCSSDSAGGDGGGGADSPSGNDGGSSSGSVVVDAGPPPPCDGGANSCTVGSCPAPAVGKVCCLHKYSDNSIQGTLTTSDGCQGGINAIVGCQNNLGDTKGCPQDQICCGVLSAVPGGPTGSQCIPTPLSAPNTFCGTNPYICGPAADGGEVSATSQCVPGAGTASAYVCAAAPATPIGALGVCVQADAGGGG